MQRVLHHWLYKGTKALICSSYYLYAWPVLSEHYMMLLNMDHRRDASSQLWHTSGYNQLLFFAFKDQMSFKEI